jgi:hypothetical protein
MAQRVVDLLEPVEVEDHQRDPGPVAARGEDRLLRAVVEQASVRQVGQRIVEREVLVLGSLAA